MPFLFRFLLLALRPSKCTCFLFLSCSESLLPPPQLTDCPKNPLNELIPSFWIYTSQILCKAVARKTNLLTSLLLMYDPAKQTMSGIRKAVSASFESILVLERKLGEEYRRGQVVKIRRVKVAVCSRLPLLALSLPLFGPGLRVEGSVTLCPRVSLIIRKGVR